MKNNNLDNTEITSNQKTRLLNLGINKDFLEDDSDSEEIKADLLYDILTGTLPMDKTSKDSLPDILQRLCQNLHSLAGDKLGDLLLYPHSDIEIIWKVKNYAKQLGTAADKKVEYDVTLAIYHAAIASALVFHDEKITQYTYSELSNSFDSLRKQDWIFHDLSQLFLKAFQICNSNKDNK